MSWYDIILYSHNDINNNNNNNTRNTNGFISFRIPYLATRGERQFIKAYVNHAMLTIPNGRRIMWCLRSQFLSAGQDPNWSDLIRSEKVNRLHRQSKFNSFFSKSSNSQAIPSGYDVNQPLNSFQPYFLFGSLLWQKNIVISFPPGCASAPSDYTTWTRDTEQFKALPN